MISYRPITLESVVGKVMERAINKRLVWKLEVEEGVAKTQFAFRKQKSKQCWGCVTQYLRREIRMKVRYRTKIRNRCNQAPQHMTLAEVDIHKEFYYGYNVLFKGQ